jgi:hypothetical protein
VAWVGCIRTWWSGLDEAAAAEEEEGEVKAARERGTGEKTISAVKTGRARAKRE